MTGEDLAQEPPDPNDPKQAVALFHAQLREITPHVRVVPAVLALNLLVFGAMVAAGVSALNPGADSMVRWGANFGPRTLGGEPWRLITNVFLHFGIVHLAFNMLALWNAGTMVERLFGPLAFVAIYFAAGISGSLTSVAIHPQTVSAGASGAVFGVYGALAAFLFRQRGVIPPPVLGKLRGVALSFIAYNIIYGLSNKSIDNAAHVGGLLGGVVAGALLVRPLVPSPARPRASRGPILVALGACLLAAATVLVLPRPLDFQQTMSEFLAVSTPAQKLYDALVDRAKAKDIDDGEFVSTIERDVLPPWREAHAQLAARQRRRWSPLQRRIIDLLEQYAAARERGWTLSVEGIRTRDRDKIKRGNQQQAEADARLRDLENLKPK